MISPAKINLGLKILFRRPDGYHELQSIFLPINWGDEISFQESENFELQSNIDSDYILNSDYYQVSEKGDLSKNILYKTFIASQERKKNLKPVKITLHKKIPTGGGLGGGSSNAAMLLKYLFPEEVQVSNNDFLKFASKIGADVPFFLLNTPAAVEGIGERLTPIEVANANGILAIPAFSISTREAFLSLKKPLQEPPISYEWNYLTMSIQSLLKRGEWSSLHNYLKNDFESYAFKTYPELETLKHTMYELGLEFVSMTGTGSCFYGLISKKERIPLILESLRNHFRNYQFVSFNT